MKKILHRSIALVLAALLLCGAVGPVSALSPRRPRNLTLGTEPSDMLAGGGKRVCTEVGQYIISDADGRVYHSDSVWYPVLEGPVAGLNYADGVLYYARPQEEGFDLCAYDLADRAETCLLADFPGTVGQLYLVDGGWLDFSSGDSVWQLDLSTGRTRRLLLAPELWSFVPTAWGLVYATGSLFHYDLYAGQTPLVLDAEDYTVRRDLGESLLVYTKGGRDYQVPLRTAFAGAAEPDAFAGLPVEESDLTGWTEDSFWEDWFEPAVSVHFQSLEEGGVQAPDAATLFSGAASRRATNSGVLNIVRRARQMLNIRWTPVQGVGGWGYEDSSYGLTLYYEPGVTYVGLPYGQGLNYVPWSTTLTGFLEAVNDETSKFYTERASYGRGSQYYGTDCSGFASWAWQTNGRKTCTGMMTSDVSVKVGRSYTLLQIGDAIIDQNHAMLVTDVTYNPDGSIWSIEVSQANPTTTYNGCAYSTTYTGAAQLERKNNDWFVNGSYSIYRGKNRDSVTYTHDCAVPLAGDVCPLCGAGFGEEDPVRVAPVGVDVSQFQGQIDWAQAGEQVDFAILRIGYTGNTLGGIYKDTKVDTNILNCVANDIPYGLYYYAGAKTPEKAMEEADAVLGWLLEGNYSPELPIFYDVEEPLNILTLSDTQMLGVISAFCGYLEDAGYRAGVYASASLWNTSLSDSAYQRWVHWIAHWDTLELTSPAGASVWQYQVAEQGTVPGISAQVDMNYWIGALGDTMHPSTVVKEVPDCGVNGTLTATCVVPNCGKVQELELRAEDHIPGEPELQNELEPTCTETGVYDEVCYCTRCGQEASRTVVTVEPLGHSYSQGFCVRCGQRQDVTDRFDDVKQDKWYTEAVRFVVENAIFSGMEEHHFGLTTVLSRAMLVTALYSLAGKPAVSGVSPFQDVKPSAYYFDPVLWAYQKGIVSGTSAATFSPKAQVTREQAARMFYVYVSDLLGAEPEAEADLSGYPDENKVQAYARTAMVWAVGSGLISGSAEDGAVYLRPGSGTQRAQAAVMFRQLARLLQELGFWSPAEAE